MNGKTTLSACKTLADFQKTREFRDILFYCGGPRCDDEAAEAYQYGIAQFVRNFGQFRGLRLVVSLLRVAASEEALLDMDNEICALGDERNRLAYFGEADDGSFDRAQDRLTAERAQYKVDLGAFQTRASRRFFSPVPVVHKPQQQSRGKQTKKASGSAEKVGDDGSGDGDGDPDPDPELPPQQQFLAHITAFRRDPSAPVANPLALSVAVLRLKPALSPREQHLVDSHTASELQRIARKISGLARRRPWGSLVGKEERDATALGLANALFMMLVNNSPEQYAYYAPRAVPDTALESMIFWAIHGYHLLDTAAEFHAAPMYVLDGTSTLAARAAKSGRAHYLALRKLEASGADARTLHEARRKYEADVGAQRVEYANSLDALLEDRGDRDFSLDKKLSSDEISGGPSATRDTPDSLHTLAMSDDEVLRFGPESERADEDIDEYLACPESTESTESTEVARVVDEDAPAVPLTPGKIADAALASSLPARTVIVQMLDALRETTDLQYLRVTRIAERILTRARKGNARAVALLREMVVYGGLSDSQKTLVAVEDFLVSAEETRRVVETAVHNQAVQSYRPLVAEALASTDDLQVALDALVDALTFPNQGAVDVEKDDAPMPERTALAVVAHSEFWSPLPPARRLYITVTQGVPELPHGAVPPSLDPPNDSPAASTPPAPRKPRIRASLPSDDPPEYVALPRVLGKRVVGALAWTAC